MNSSVLGIYAFASLVGAVGSPVAFGASGGLEIRVEKLQERDAAGVAEFISELKSILPASVAEAIRGPVRLRFEKLDRRKSIAPPSCAGEEAGDSAAEADAALATGEGASVLGRTPRYFIRKSPLIRLNRNFLLEIARGPDGSTRYPCGHGNLYRLALATAIHEIAHQHLSRAGRKFREDYRDLLEWKRGFLRQKSKNRLTQRSPDPYEFKSLAEHFAVNTEFFLLDPQYRCRRPEQFRFFERHFGMTPFAGRANCEPVTEVRLSSTQQPVQLDPARTYEIHYLLADKGDSMESKWGHSMFRIVQCARSRTEVGPDCVQDIGSHVVLSFRANVSGVTLNKLGGAFGKYPSQMFVYSMPEIVGEYTLGESRALKSVPLRLTADQVSRFVSRALEYYWEYQGRYYFFTNSCATESLDFLKGVLADDGPELRDPMVATPIGIYKQLRKRGLLEESVLSAERAVGRYLFPSFSARAAEAFGRIAGLAGAPPELTLKSYTEEFSPRERRELYFKLKAENPPWNLAASFYLLEYLIRDRTEESLKSRVSRVLDGAEAQGERKAAAERLQRVIEQVTRLRAELQPWFYVHSGYGVPQPGDFVEHAQVVERMDRVNALIREAREELKAQADSEAEDYTAEISANIKFFMSEMKKIQNGNSG